MKITDKFKRKEIAFRYVDATAVFKHKNNYYMVTVEIEDNDGDVWNCVNLNSGEHYFFDSDDIVEVLEAEMIVK